MLSMEVNGTKWQRFSMFSFQKLIRVYEKVTKMGVAAHSVHSVCVPSVWIFHAVETSYDALSHHSINVEASGKTITPKNTLKP